MTDKQLERAKEIKEQIADLEKLKGMGISYSGDGVVDIFSNPVYSEFQKIEKRVSRQWDKLVDSKILILQKEFAKL